MAVLVVAAGSVVHHHHRYLRLADQHRARSMVLRMELRDRKRRPATHEGRRSLIREIHRHEELAVRYDAAAFQPLTGVSEHPSSPICICPICYDR